MGLGKGKRSPKRFYKKYSESATFRRGYALVVNIVLPLVLQFVLALGIANNFFRFVYLGPFVVLIVVWLSSAWHLRTLEEKIPESEMETKLAMYVKRVELAESQIRSQILKYESLKSLIESIHTRDINAINKALNSEYRGLDSFLAHFDINRQLRFTILQIAYYLNNFCDGSRFRVTLMEPDDDRLVLTHWSNWGNGKDEVPEMNATHAGLRRGEGCAGKAWLDRQTVFIASIEDDQRNVKVYKRLDPYRKPRTKSVASIPIMDVLRAPHEVVGILNVDSDVDGFFQKTNDAEEYSHPQIDDIQHFFHLIVFYKRVSQLFQNIHTFNA